MSDLWSSLLRRGNARRVCSGKAGCRLYAIGDVHGRLDLLDELLDQVVQDMVNRTPKKTFLVFLGDLIDRGPDSAGVIERLRTYAPLGLFPIFLRGNHEEALLRILEGEGEILADWLKYGGDTCVASYGLDPDTLAQIDPIAAIDRMRAKIPRAHRAFLRSFGDTFRFGDYLCVHAGIRPGVSLGEQTPADLHWIREPFLSDRTDHGFVVIHGHTVVEEVDEQSNRIGIDTGAYRTGNLTALAVEEDRRWYLKTNKTGLFEGLEQVSLTAGA